MTVVNFTVTFEGLEDQLLADVAMLERPDLESRKESLVVQIAEGRKQIKDLEDKIIRMLAESSGNILDDEELIEALDSSKKTSAKTEVAVKGAEETSREIDVAREAYRPVATRGSILYFVVADFAAVDPMYQYSLQYFKEIFCQTVKSCAKSDNLDERLALLLDAETKNMFVMICRGLFEKHKGLFAFMICVSMLRQAGRIAADEWAFLLRSTCPTDNLPPKPAALALDDRAWSFVVAADAELVCYGGLQESCTKNAAAWQAFLESDAPQDLALPPPYDASLSSFQRLLALNSAPRRWCSGCRSSSASRWAPSSRRRRRLTSSRPTTTRRRARRSSSSSRRAPTRRSTCSRSRRRRGLWRARR